MSFFHTMIGIYTAVKDRGYLDGWTPEQIVARNLTKLVEETGELAELLTLPEIAGNEIARSAMTSKQAFEARAAWTDEHGIRAGVDLEKLKKEIADIFVVMAVLSTAVNVILAKNGKPAFDPVVAAVEKANADVKRGTRYSNDRARYDT